MAAAAATTATAVLVVLGWCAGGGTAVTDHFVQRVIQSNYPQDDQSASSLASDPLTQRFAAASASDSLRRTIRLHLPPSLGDALSKAMSYEANRSRLRWRATAWRDEHTGGSSETESSGGDEEVDHDVPHDHEHDAAEDMDPWSGGTSTSTPHHPEETARLPPLLFSAIASDLGAESDTPDTPPPVTESEEDDLHLNITESRTGCDCSGVPAAPGRTVAFLLTGPLPSEDARLDLHLPVSGESAPSSASTVTIQAPLTLCTAGGAGRSVTAALRLKRAPRRPRWRHAIVGAWLAQLRPRAAAPTPDAPQCLLVVLPETGAAGPIQWSQDHSRLARLTARPPRRRGHWAS